MVQQPPDIYALEQAKMESTLLHELKKFVISWGWTYAVIWKIGPDHRTPVWHQSYFNEFEETEVGQAQRFENIFKRCQFTPARPGYAYLAWHRQSPYWWTKELKEPAVPTDENKELFLMTLVCFPGRAPPDDSGYCVELASTSLVPESDYFKVPIRDFATSIAPQISSSSTPLLQEFPALQAIPSSSTSMSPAAAAQAMAVVAHQQDSAILTDISNQAAIHGEDEAITGYNNLLRQEVEPYYPWTMSSSQNVSVGLSNYPLANFGDYYYPSFDIGTISYDSSSQILEPFQSVEPNPQGWTQAPSSSGTTPQGSTRKGKDILVETELPEGDVPITQQKQLVPSTSQTSLSLLQEEFLEKLRKPPSPPLVPSLVAQDNPQMVIPPSGIIDSGTVFPIPSSSSAGWRPIGGQPPPGHSPASLFQPNRHARYPRFGARSTRSSLIHTWATALAPLMRMRGPGSGGPASEIRHGFDSPATHNLDPRSPTSLVHDHLAAEAHKIAERKRRNKMNNKLRTLISIVPIIDKKDKVSVLTSTIEYIRQLTSRISSFENREEAPATSTLRVGDEAMISMDREEELALFTSNIDSGAGAGPSSSSTPGAPVVVVEGSPDSETWLIKVQANSHLRSLIQLLNVFHDLGLEVTTVDYSTMNGQFRANVCIKNSRNSSTNSSLLKETLQRVLESVVSSPSGSD